MLVGWGVAVGSRGVAVGPTGWKGVAVAVELGSAVIISCETTCGPPLAGEEDRIGRLHETDINTRIRARRIRGCIKGLIMISL